MSSGEKSMIKFKDLESGSEGIAIVRSSLNAIGVALSLEENGDLEVFMSLDDASKLVDVLQGALANAREDE